MNDELADGSIPEYYADSAFLRWTPYGFTLEIGEPGDDTGLSKVRLRVKMSPQMALSMAGLFDVQVSNFQQTFGPLNITPLSAGDDITPLSAGGA